MHAYIAGPLFNEGERWFDEQIDACVQRAGLTTFLPHRDGLEGKLDIPDRARRIFIEDAENVARADIVVANLNGITVDDGTAWEIGYAYGKGKHIVGVFTDWRAHFKDYTVNLMLECSLNKLVHSLDELESYLKEIVAAGTG